MKVNTTKTKTDIIYYLTKGVRVDGKVKTIRIETIGHHSELIKKYDDPMQYAKEYAKIKTDEEKNKNFQFNITGTNAKLIEEPDKNFTTSNLLNIGHLYLKKIINEFKLENFFKEISKDSKVEYNCSEILSLLTYGRILDPLSKKGTFDKKESYYNSSNDIEIQHIYRFLSFFSNHLDEFQTHLYKQSLDVVKRNTSVLYYDCTNFFFEIENEDDLKKYGKSKENRPNPIVQMGLFMDGDGMPLAFCITPGNEHETKTVKPLEQKIIKDFELSKFIYCADAGLATSEIRRFNDKHDRSFVVTQSIKKMTDERKKWCTSRNQWMCTTIEGRFDLDSLDEQLINYSTKEIDNLVFYKEMTISDAVDIGLRKENGRKDKGFFEQRIIVTYRRKYAKYQSKIRLRQLERAYKMAQSPSKETKNVNSPSRFIIKEKVTDDGTQATKTITKIDLDLVAEESKYDGIYAVATTLTDKVSDVIKVMSRKWEIEDCFRVMKTNFDARPVYLQREDRIKSHFGICFFSLLIFRILEKRLKNVYTITEIITTLQNLNVLKINDAIYKTTYSNSNLLQELNKVFNTEIDSEYLLNTNLKV